MKLNYIGIIGAILAFVSIALPWWTWSMTYETIGGSADLYLYQNSGTFWTSLPTADEAWFCWAALVFIIVGGLLGIVGSATGYGKKMLIGGGVLALLSIIIFAVGLQNWLSPLGGLIGVFSSGSGYSSYLSYGFWLALAAMILMFVAIIMKPKEQVTQLPSTPPAQA